MKNYFKTRNHIYKRLFNDKAIINELGIGNCYSDTMSAIDEEILKESDNLEDLLDEVVVDCKLNVNKKPFITILSPTRFKEKKPYVNVSEEILNNTIYYGAIWTYRGLIYVSKLVNEEFKLLCEINDDK